MKVTYGDSIFEVPDNSSVEELKESLSSIYPEIANASHRSTEDGIELFVQAGTKGADVTVHYGENVFTVNANQTDEDIKEALSAIYPEVSNATATREGNKVTLSVQAGTKGADVTVHYGENVFTVNANQTDSEIKEALSAIYPEVSNATVTRDGDVVTLSVQAGTKGSNLNVRYGENVFSIPGNQTDAEIKEALAAIYPEVANATVTRDGNDVTLSVQAGTKGN